MKKSLGLIVIIAAIFVLVFLYLMTNMEHITKSISVPEKSDNCTEYDLETEICYANLEGPGELICPKGKNPDDLYDVEGCRGVDRCCEYSINVTLIKDTILGIVK